MSDQEEWDKWFSVQYDLMIEIEALINAQLKGSPSVFRSMVYMGLIEGWAERARFDIVLPPFPKDADPELKSLDDHPGAPAGTVGG